MCCDTVNRGVAYADGKIFLHQADTTLVALDRQDRKSSGGHGWRGRQAPGRTDAPFIFKDKVFVGISAASSRSRLVSAYNIKAAARLARPTPRGRCRNQGSIRKRRRNLQAGRQGFSSRPGRRSMEDRRGHHLGLVLLRRPS